MHLQFDKRPSQRKGREARIAESQAREREVNRRVAERVLPVLQQVRERNQELRVSIQALSEADGSPNEEVWSTAAEWRLVDLSRPRLNTWTVTYLGSLGYEAADARRWKVKPVDPGPGPKLRLHIDTQQGVGHQEHAGYTWYFVDCELVQGSSMDDWLSMNIADEEQNVSGTWLESASIGSGRRLAWRAPRRLAQIRESLHDPVRQTLDDDEYEEVFADAPFALRGGWPGTTARLCHWLSTLACAINCGGVPPSIAALTLLFFRGTYAPEPAVSEGAEPSPPRQPGLSAPTIGGLLKQSAPSECTAAESLADLELPDEGFEEEMAVNGIYVDDTMRVSALLSDPDAVVNAAQDHARCDGEAS
eukprot:TRINITY_DN29264_c0_g1_i1.p1 TRINITY_DN29264_c0_g1~~TRINITY_DN29264_c0_g1_i1.p1  ORF type:complete len:362 (-),score=58.49 TRINITY_DN29264_c0_g1_i1:370-1455(-)